MMVHHRDAACPRPEPIPRRRLRWDSLPVLTSPRAQLRELQPADVPSLLTLVGDADVQRFLSGCPTTSEAMLRYIRWAQRARRMGQHVSFGVVPHGVETIAGIFQLWRLESGFQTAEWGFALGEAFWGTGLFIECAEQVVDFAMDQVGVWRLEARVAIDNVAGNAALQKLGAVREGVLRRCFECSGHMHDHLMWAILRDEWLRYRQRPSSEAGGTGTGNSYGSLGDGAASWL